MAMGFQRFQNFSIVGDGIAITAASSSAAVAFPTLAASSFATDCMIYNSSTTVAAFVTFGDASTITAAIPTGTSHNGIIVAPGTYLVLDKGYATYIATITASSTAVLYVYQGLGS